MPRHPAAGHVRPLLLIAVALVFAVAGYWIARTQGAATPPPGATATSTLRQYPEPRVIADFALVDQFDQPYNLQRWRNRHTLVFFGFTHCPDICPGTLAMLAGLQQRLAEHDVTESQLAIHFISVDPERDSPRHLRQYVEHFSPTFTAATGPPAQLAALTRQLGVIYVIEEHAPDDRGYQVDHGASVLLINRQARLAGQFPPPHSIDAMAMSLLALLESGS